MALPVVRSLYGFPAPDPSQTFFNAFYDGAFGTATSTKLVLATPNGSRIVFKGDFTVDGMGVVTAGTITGYNVFAGNTKVMKADGYDISATGLVDAVEQWQLGDYEPLVDVLLDLPTKYLGSELGDFVRYFNGPGSVFNGRQGDDGLVAATTDITLKGGKGNDLLVAAEGLCWYSGGEGKDVFLFVDPTLANKIKDFSPEDDLLSINTDAFVGVEPGLLADSQFKIGKYASTPEQIIIYQRHKGIVWFDQDGSDQVYTAVKFAKIDKDLDLTAHNFYGEIYGLIG